MSESSAEKTEQPTEKRLQDARRDGNVGQSQDLVKTLLLGIWLLALTEGGEYIVHHLIALMDIWKVDFRMLTADLLGQMTLEAGERMMLMLWPFLLLAFLSTLMISFVQIGPLFALKKAKPDPGRVNPADGFKKIFSRDNLFEVIKSLIKTTLLFVMAFLCIKQLVVDSQFLAHGTAGHIFSAWWSGIKHLLFSVLVLFLLISVIDVAYQKYSHLRQLKMSMQDIQREYKENEGDPMLKGHRKQLHQEWSEQGIANAVSRASVIVANPVHIAIALRYEKDTDSIPVVVAKGKDHVATHIRNLALEHQIPIFPNIELARALYRDIPLYHHITEDFFVAVAEVLRWVEESRRETAA